jgi:hypothetical protein
VQPSLPVLSEAAPQGVDPGPALAACSKWAAVPDSDTPLTAAGLRALADHLEQTLPSLAGELRSLSADADAKYAEREDAWAPIAAAVLAWCASAEDAQASLAPRRIGQGGRGLAEGLTRWLNETADLVALLQTDAGLIATSNPS